MKKIYQTKIKQNDIGDCWSNQKNIMIQMVLCLEALTIDQTGDMKHNIKKVVNLLKEKIIKW